MATSALGIPSTPCLACKGSQCIRLTETTAQPDGLQAHLQISLDSPNLQVIADQTDSREKCHSEPTRPGIPGLNAPRNLRIIC